MILWVVVSIAQQMFSSASNNKKCIPHYSLYMHIYLYIYMYIAYTSTLMKLCLIILEALVQVLILFCWKYVDNSLNTLSAVWKTLSPRAICVPWNLVYCLQYRHIIQANLWTFWLIVFWGIVFPFLYLETTEAANENSGQNYHTIHRA